MTAGTVFQLELTLDSTSEPSPIVEALLPIQATEPQSAPALLAKEESALALLSTLNGFGLRGVQSCRLTRNRAVLVSFRRHNLRVHEAFTAAPEEVLRAIVAFVNQRGAAQRRARRIILEYPVEHRPGAPRRMRTQARDAALAARLAAGHRRLNEERFGGVLRAIDVRVSRRMSSRLGLFRLQVGGAGPAEIVISWRHIRRHGWQEALATLVHEMVHQWQHEQGLPVDHGPVFRRKAREVGITPSATRRADDAKPGDVSTCAA
jgi:hypothetical protein